MSEQDDFALVTVRSSSEADLSELRDYMASVNCTVGPTTHETLPADLNLDPALAMEIVSKVLLPVVTSLLPKLVEWAIEKAKRKPDDATPIIIEVRGKRIIVRADSSPEAIHAAIAAAIGR